MVSYDRIFEHLNLATEMISGQPHDFTLASSLYRIFTRKKNQMGHVYVKYLTPIGIDDYLQRHFVEGIADRAAFSKAACQLTEYLLKV